ncbi:dynamin family protein [Aquabacterium sp. OR-4]|uniref:dynamin family protein n=1 Tax=Aquabacterium sp. OR-4 TaxID=2978127 RepID=UPI0021B4496E|nr:dynamin family protein [Aquabacterium sp. OR-4]MDT7837296.1 dynamin family protein [Aquabacterium sp. OR-4]
MNSPLLTSIDTLATWRRGLDLGVERFSMLLSDHGLLDGEDKALAQALRQRLAADRLVVAFVAEFSRGKSELINALFFADSGRRVMPATPGRTTMCPVELGWDAQQPPSLALLPIDTRIGGQPVAVLREQPELWQQVPLQVTDADAMAAALERVTHTQRVPVAHARALGFWNDEHPEDNPPCDSDDMVEVPAWRHALVNLPHPLLRRGLVVVDTPGLNAIGAEPELTLSLLPSAHATVFVLAADTGVTKADLTVWRDHLGDRAFERFVVLNKIDTLTDPLRSADEVEALLQRQCQSVCQTLDVPRERVFPLSARDALAGRVRSDGELLARSRLPVLEDALLQQLLPQRSRVIGRMVEDGARSLHQGAVRRLAERQRQVGEQLYELKSLSGKSLARLQLMTGRLDAEAAEFERCAPRLAALRMVLSRESHAVLDSLSSEQVRDAVLRMRSDSESSLLRLGAARAFALLGERLRGLIFEADRRLAELESMLATTQGQLNGEFGLTLGMPPRPVAADFIDELKRIEHGYARHVSITQVWRLAQPGFIEQFSRLLLSKLRVIFEGAAHEIEGWLRSVGSQMDEQLREHRKALQQRREAHGRIRDAESGLERSIADLEAQDARMARLAESIDAEFDRVRRRAAMAPSADTGASPRLQLVTPAEPAVARGAA